MPAIQSDLCFLTPKPIQHDLPLFVFLPGMDGTGKLLYTQADSLEKCFDIRCLAIGRKNLSDWNTLAERVLELIKAELEKKSQRFAYLCGESFGGCLAIELARRSPQIFNRIILINPASCFKQQPLLGWGEHLVSWMPDSLYQGVTLGLLPFIAALERLKKSEQRALLEAMKSIPSQTASWRLSLLADFILEERLLNALKLPVLILASARDGILPSVREAKRLVNILPQGQMVVLPSSGHTCLLERDISLYKIIKAKNFLEIDPYQKSYFALA